MKKSFLIISTFLEFVIIIFLGIQIYKKKNNILGVTNVNPLKKVNLVFYKSGDLKYFFEPSNVTYEEPNIFWLKQPVIYEMNKDTLNSPKEFSLDKSKNTYRIITLGDSFTFGLYVNTENNWPQQLEKLLNENLKCSPQIKFEIINLGVMGYDIQYSVERFKIRGQKYDPDLVLWFLKDDDIIEVNEIMRAKEQEIIEEMEKSGEWQKELDKGNPYPQVKEMHDYVVQEYKKIGEPKMLKMAESYLEDINKYYSKDLVIFTFPFYPDKYKKVFSDFTASRPHSYFFDGLTNIYNDKSNYFYPYDFHPNEKGHQIIAQDLFNYLTKNKIIPCD